MSGGTHAPAGARGLHRFLLFTACCTFLLVVAGGLVTSTQSGLSVPDWPETYGHFMFAFPLDQMVGGIFYEHSHRMIAATVGFLTLVAAFWMWRREKRRWVRNLGFGALALVIVQGILGGLTVRYLLPVPISVGHAALAQTFFSVMCALALFSSPWWTVKRLGVPKSSGDPPAAGACAAAAAAVFFQLVLGALMRHTGSGLAVPDFPLAFGGVFPSLTPEALAEYNRRLIDLNIRIAADDPVTAGQVLLHLAHRAWAVVAGLLVLRAAFRIGKLSRVTRRFSLLSVSMTVLVLLQITLGAASVLTGKDVAVTTAHVAGGALLLASCVLALLHAAGIYGVRFPARATSPVPAEAR